MTDTNPWRKYIQVAAFLLFIIGLPMGSWYYLQAGFDYHKELMSELKDYGPVPNFELVNQNGDTVSTEYFREKVIVVTFFNKEKESFPITMDYLRRMYSQFHDRDDIVFLSKAHPSSQPDIMALKTIARKEDLTNMQCLFLKGEQSEMQNLMVNGYKIPDIKNRAEDKTIPLSSDISKAGEDYPYFILIDDKGTIRNYYDIHQEESITKLVEHLAIILPRKSEEKAELKREKEK